MKSDSRLVAIAAMQVLVFLLPATMLSIMFNLTYLMISQ